MSISQICAESQGIASTTSRVPPLRKTHVLGVLQLLFQTRLYRLVISCLPHGWNGTGVGIEPSASATWSIWFTSSGGFIEPTGGGSRGVVVGITRFVDVVFFVVVKRGYGRRW